MLTTRVDFRSPEDRAAQLRGFENALHFHSRMSIFELIDDSENHSQKKK